MTLDGVLAVAFLAIVFGGIAGAAVRYHYLTIIEGQRDAIEALQEYIHDHSDVDNVEDLWGHG